MKKLLSILLLACMFITVSTQFSNVQALEAIPNDEDIGVFVIGPCPVHGTHYATPSGTYIGRYDNGDGVYNANDPIIPGGVFSEYKCTYCGKSLFSNGVYLYRGGYLDYWFTKYEAITSINGSGCIIVKRENVYRETEVPGLEGWVFGPDNRRYSNDLNKKL
jgi:hypothetical protein